MAPTIEIWNTGGSGYTDYSAWLWSQDTSTPLITKTHQVNTAQQIKFALQNGVTGLVVPDAGNRIRVTTNNYGQWFTGYLTQIPQLTVIGSNSDGTPVYGYQMLAVSEELRLEWQTSAIFPTLAPFANRTQGQIIKSMIAALGGGFDVTNVADGITIPLFRVKPDEAFGDAVRRLSDKTNMAFWTKNGLAYYQSYGATPFGFTPTDGDAFFDPTMLTVNPVQNPVFNDVLGTGPVEPQNFVREMFVGDGLTAVFPLKFPMYGSTSQKLLQDDFTATQIDTTVWINNSTTDPNTAFSSSAGSLQMAASGASTPSRLSSINGIDVGGNILLGAGRISFGGASDVIVGGAFGADTGLLADCVCGFQCLPSSGQTVIKPIINGVAQSASYTTVAGKSYQFYITIDVDQAIRIRRPYFSLYANYGGGTTAANAVINFVLVELDNNTPDIPNVQVMNFSAPITSIAAYLFYSVLAGPQSSSNAVNLALNFTGLFNPVQAELSHQIPGTVVWVRQRMGSDGSDPLAIAAVTIGSDSTPQLEYVGLLQPDPGVLIRFSYRSAGISRGRVKLSSSITAEAAKSGDGGERTGTLPAQTPPPRDSTEIDSACQAFISDRTNPLFSGDWTFNTIAYASGSTASDSFDRANESPLDATKWTTGQTGFALQVVSDQCEAVSTVAAGGSGFYAGTFPNDQWAEVVLRALANTGSFAGPMVRASASQGYAVEIFGVFGSVAFGQIVSLGVGALGGFSITPNAGDRIRLEVVGTAMTVKQNGNVIHTATDSGLASGAPGAIVAASGAVANAIIDNFACGPMGALEVLPGRLLTGNVTTRYPVFTALVTAVESRLLFQDSDTTELFEFDVTFGPLYRLDDESVQFQPADEALQGTLDTLVDQTAIEFASVGAAYAAAVGFPTVSSKTGTTYEIDAGMAPTSAFEVRKTDAAWGSGSAINTILSPDPATETFAVPRNSGDVTVLLKNKDGSGLVSRYAAAIRINWPQVPLAPVLDFVDQTDPTHPILNLDLDPAQNPQDVYTMEIRGADDVTIVQAATPIIAPSDLQYTVNNSGTPATAFTFFIYFINLLGEYSPPLELVVDLTQAKFAEEILGANLVANPGFELGSATYPTSPVLPTDEYVSDSWVALSESGPQWVMAALAGDIPNSGQKNALIRLATGQTIPHATLNNTIGYLQNSAKDPSQCITVRGGDTYYFGGYALWSELTGLPSGVTGTIGFRVRFYESDGTFISSMDSVSIQSPTSVYGGSLQGVATVPSNAAFMTFNPFASINNGSGSDFTTGSTLYMDARFDDCFCEKKSESLIPSDPTALVLTSGDATALQRGDGIRISRILASWSVSANYFDQSAGFVDVQYKESANPFWIDAGSVSGDQDKAYITGVNDGVTYDVQIRSRNALGGTSNWVSVTNFTVATIVHGSLSYLIDGNPLIAHDAGGTSTILINNWDTIIAGVGDINYTPTASITGLNPSTLYYTYYSDATLAGGAVTVFASQNKSDAVGVTAGLFFLGSIVTPATGAPDTKGNKDGGVAAQTGAIDILPFNVSLIDNVGGNGAINNPQNAVDGDPTTYTEIMLTGDGNDNFASLAFSSASGFTRAFSGIQVIVDMQLVTNSLNQAGNTASFFYSTNGDPLFPNGWFGFLVPPATFLREKFVLVLPLGINTGQVMLKLGAACLAATSGAFYLRIFGIWIEATE